MTAREVILSRIRSSRTKPFVADRARPTDSTRERAAIVEQFAEYAAEYKANVVRVRADKLGEIVADFLNGRVLVPMDFPLDWLSQSTCTIVPDNDLTIPELDASDAVITFCALAIAETGTVVLDHGVGQGRRALTLVPDHHVVIVPADRIVDSVPEAIERLAEAVQSGCPLTWISGPSAPSDIELSRVEGVHGPRRLDIIILED